MVLMEWNRVLGDHSHKPLSEMIHVGHTFGAGTRANSSNPGSDLRDPRSDLRDPNSDLRHPSSDLRDPSSDLWDPSSDLRDPSHASLQF